MKRVIASVVLGLGFAIVNLQAQSAEDHSKHQPAPPKSPPQGHSQPSGHDHSEHDAHAGHDMSNAQAPTDSERQHVPPDPPQNPLGDMSEERMIELMQMEDNAALGMVLLDQIEYRKVNGADVQAWELQAWYGTDYNKIWFETEREREDGEEAGRVEVMWDRIISPWWSLQSGVRYDFAEGPSRTWADFGIQGLAPYFFEVDAAIYIGEQGRTAARFSGEYDMLLTQRLILQPELEFELYGKDDPENRIGSGFSDMEIGLRLRYEIRREFAPYVGVHYERKFGRTADFAREDGQDASDLVFVAGLRAWF